MEIFKAPKILILHLKRFRSTSVGRYGNYFFSDGGQKITESIDYPIEGLDMS